MGRYLLKTLLTIIPTLFGVVTIVFFLIHLTPGDPALAMLGPYATADSIQELRKTLGLDQPLYLQYCTFMGHLLQGDLGRSLVTDQPVLSKRCGRFPIRFSWPSRGCSSPSFWEFPSVWFRQCGGTRFWTTS